MLGLGGTVDQNRPVAAVHQLIRNGIEDLCLVGGPSVGYDVDLMIGCGMVRELYIPTVTMGELGLAPMFRWVRESGRLSRNYMDVLTLIAGYQASALGLPFFPVAAAWRGSDVIARNPLITPLPAPFEGTFAVAPIVPEVTVIHGAQGDEYGNLRSYSSMRSLDVYLAKASKFVIATVDQLIPNDEIRANPQATTLSGHHVDIICEAPSGAHPTASPPHYPPDLERLREYHSAAEAKRRGDAGDFNSYLERHVFVDAPQ
jgi:glutaconate CoA-transferase subunit A